jgi:hypothetical protein
MTISNWLFGFWGLANLVALAVAYFPTPRFAVDSFWTVLFAVSVAVPFAQTVLLSLKWNLNFNKGASSEYRQQVYRRQWQILRRTPIASTAMILCIIAAIAMQIAFGPARLRAAPDHVRTSGPFIAFLIAFSAISAHFNLFVARKCQDIIKSPLQKNVDGKNSSKRKRKGKV